MANNVERIPGSGTGYVDWSRNITPMIQNWVDLSKYKMQRDDENRRQAMVALLQSGAMQPEVTSLATFGGMNLKPLTLEEQLYKSGKGMNATKDYYDILNTQQDVAKKIFETQVMSNYLKTNPEAIAGTIGGIMSVPKTEEKAGKGILDFFKKRNDPKRMRATALLKTLGYEPTEENITQIMSNPTFK